MQLHDVHQGVHRRKPRKRVGRGIGSGHGKTSSKGHKGHASRQGFKLNPIFEGGQILLQFVDFLPQARGLIALRRYALLRRILSLACSGQESAHE